MDNKPALFLHDLQFTHFRCFEQQTIYFDASIAIIEGANGSGKSSILEALYYACYFRSFRTHNTRDLIMLGQHHTTIGITFYNTLLDEGFRHSLHVGLGNERLVRVNDKVVHAHKEVTALYRAIAVTEQDLTLLQDSPQYRRSFIDQSLLLINPAYAEYIHALRNASSNRNALLAKEAAYGDEMYAILSKQLWDITRKIQHARLQMLELITIHVNTLLRTYFGKDNAFESHYESKNRNLNDSHEQWFAWCEAVLASQERRYRRSLFGAHLDEIQWAYCGKPVRFFASRGQQKLLVMLLKVAQLQIIQKHGGNAILLLDDVMIDFDDTHLGILIHLLTQLDTQLIFSCPLAGYKLDHHFSAPVQKIIL